MNKKLKKITPKIPMLNQMGFKSADIFHEEFEIEPFLVFTEFRMDKATFPPHPHAGISVMTYMMPNSKGSFLNRDSLGDYSIIEPGGIHVTQAGIGVKHEETPTIHGVDCHGFQIWINHSYKDRLISPKSFHAFAKDVPEYITETIKLRVLQGKFKNLISPIELVTKTFLFDIQLEPNSSIELDSYEMAFIFLMKGEIIIDEKKISTPSIINFEKSGDKLLINSSSQPSNFIFASGTPINEPFVVGGPFVMTTKEQMTETKRRFANNEMGILEPI